jgi:hypothetical protein
MSNSSDLAWSAGKGTIAAPRLADDTPGAGQGFRLLPFTAPVSSRARRGPLAGDGSSPAPARNDKPNGFFAACKAPPFPWADEESLPWREVRPRP